MHGCFRPKDGSTRALEIILEKIEPYFQVKPRSTYFAESMGQMINEGAALLLSDYDMFLIASDIYKENKTKYLRGDHPSIDQYKRTRNALKRTDVIGADRDYRRLWRVMSRGMMSADEAVCAADPFCYVSHISAMQRYGLTLRRPEALHITRASPTLGKKMISEQLEKNEERLTFNGEVIQFPKFTQHKHPRNVRGRKIEVKATNNLGAMREVRGSNVRVASIGQVFLDMLVDPQICGGMAHVLDVWEEHARIYLEEIVERIDVAGSGLAKVRAGYILEERLKMKHAQLLCWADFAQRGGSRVLDSSQPYKNKFSEKWMISLNVR